MNPQNRPRPHVQEAWVALLLSWPILGYSQAVVATVPVGNGPVAVAVNSVTNQIYVLNQTSDNVSVIDGITNNTTTVPVGPDPVDIAVNPVTNQIYVVNQASDNVSVIDGATNITTTVAVGTYPVHLAVNPVTNQIYVANRLSNNVTIIDGASNNTTTVTAGVFPSAVAVNSVTNQIYVTNFCGSDLNCLSVGSVTVIDGATNNTTSLTTAYGPDALAVDSVLNLIFVQNSCDDQNCYFSGGLGVIGATMLGNGFSLLSQAGRGSMAVNPVTNLLYIEGLFVCDLPNFDNVIQLSVPAAVLAVNEVTNKIYGTAYQSSVVVMDGATNNFVLLTAGSDTFALAVNSVTNLIYVVNQGSNNVTVINGGAQFTGVAPTTTSLTSDNNPALPLQAVTFTAVVTSGTGVTPTGTVTFSENGNTLEAGLLNSSGIATFATSSLELGSYYITAAYGGDANFSASTSLSLLQVIALDNSVPTLTSLSPNSVIAGSAAFTLTVTGTNFESAPVVQWNGAPLATTFVSSTQLTATVPASDIASAGTSSITVSNPPPGGGTSSALAFSIADFTLSTVTGPQTVIAGQSAVFTISTTAADGDMLNVTFSATGLPMGAAATFNPSSVAPGTGTTMTITTTARSVPAAVGKPFGEGAPRFPESFPGWLAFLGLAMLPIGASFLAMKQRSLRGFAPVVTLTLLLVAAGCLAGCAGDSPHLGTDVGTPAGSYPVTVNGTSGGDTHSIIVTLVVQ